MEVLRIWCRVSLFMGMGHFPPTAPSTGVDIHAVLLPELLPIPFGSAAPFLSAPLLAAPFTGQKCGGFLYSIGFDTKTRVENPPQDTLIPHPLSVPMGTRSWRSLTAKPPTFPLFPHSTVFFFLGESYGNIQSPRDFEAVLHPGPSSLVAARGERGGCAGAWLLSSPPEAPAFISKRWQMSCTLPGVRGGSSPSGPGSSWEGEMPSQPHPGDSGCPQRVPTAPGWVPAHPVPAPLHPPELLPMGPGPEGLGPSQGPSCPFWGCHCWGIPCAPHRKH